MIENYYGLYKSTKDLFIIEGINAIEKAQEYNLKIIHKFSTINTHGFIKITTQQMNKITNNDHVKYVAIVKYIAPNFLEKGPYVLLDHLQDCGNIGTIIRNCHAFGFTNIIIYGDFKKVWHHKTIESSRYLLFKDMPLILEDCSAFLQKKNLILTTLDGSIMTRSLTSNDVIVFGNETSGISEEIKKLPHEKFTIPTNIESLNVACASTIVLYLLKYNI